MFYEELETFFFFIHDFHIDKRFSGVREMQKNEVNIFLRTKFLSLSDDDDYLLRNVQKN